MPEHQPEWHREILPAGWARTVDALAARSVLRDFYLAGGTGLALHLGHRRSLDLDLFRLSEFTAGDLRARLRDVGGLRDIETARGTLHLELHGTKVSFLHYPYPLLFPARPFEVLTVADPRDIACMKVDAIASRGSRRDFVDLYVAAQAYGLRELLELFGNKYASTPYNRMHLLKALTYFRDAEDEPMPDMVIALDWSAVKTFFTAHVPRLMEM